MITALAALVLAIAAATRLHRWWYQRSLTLAGAFIVLTCMSLHMILNIQSVEDFVRATFGMSMPGSLKMLLVCGICVGTACVFTDVTSRADRRKKLLRFHIAMALLTAALSFVFFYTKPWPEGVTNREFDDNYAFLPGYAEGLMLGMAYPFLLCLMVTVIAIAQADRRTVTGRGLMLMAPGAAILTSYAALRIGYLFAARYGLMEPTPLPFAVSRWLAIAGVFLIAAGVLAALMMNWRAARAALRQFADVLESAEDFTRTAHRRDFSLPPTGRTVLDALKGAGYTVMGVGKIEDIFCMRGLTESVHSAGNTACLEQLRMNLKKDFTGLCFVNLVDYDMSYGHRNDVKGYAAALEAFDRALPGVCRALSEDDALLITADHGCDPSTPSTDHDREYVPLLWYSPRMKRFAPLGTRQTYADMAATVAEAFALPDRFGATSFWPELQGAMK